MTYLFFGLLVVVILEAIYLYFAYVLEKPKPKRKKKKRELPDIPVPEYPVKQKRTYDDYKAKVQKELVEYKKKTTAPLFPPSLFRYSLPLIPPDKESSLKKQWEDNPPDLFYINEDEIPEGISPEEWYTKASDILLGLDQTELSFSPTEPDDETHETL